MDQLVFFIQQRGSMSRKILFSIFIVFTFISKCTPKQEICTINNNRNVTYFEENTKEANWIIAWQVCTKPNSSLPIICNKDEQDAFIRHVKEIGGSSTVWTAGKRNNLINWTWINGQRYMGRDEIIITTPAAAYDTHAVFDGTLRYKSAYPGFSNFYLCQYSGSLCDSGNVTRVTNGCVGESNDSKTFYDARNQCLMNGGDLAILNDADLVTLNRSKRLNAPHGYWVGLRNYTWHWIYQQTANSSEIKYTNWNNDDHYFPDNECISINASNGKWKAVQCAYNNKVICERISDTTISSSTSSTTTPSSASSTTMSSSKSTTTTSNSTTQSSTEVPNKLSIYAAVGAAIVVIVICIIVILFVVRYKRKSHKNQDRLKDNKQLDCPRSNEFRNNPSSNSPANAPAKAAVTKAEDVGGVYAEIPLTSLSQAEDGAQTQQPGVVYASLEFQKEPTYMEPNSKRASADRTKAGPMGDIYAMPDTRNGVAKTPGGAIYANT